MKAERVLSVLLFVVFSFFATAQIRNAPSGDEPGIHRSLLVDEPTVQAARVTYAAGAIEPAGVHSYDVLVIPLNRGAIRLNVPGKPDPKWEPGSVIFIKRGTQHRLANVGEKPIQFITVRIP